MFDNQWWTVLLFSCRAWRSCASVQLFGFPPGQQEAADQVRAWTPLTSSLPPAPPSTHTTTTAKGWSQVELLCVCVCVCVCVHVRLCACIYLCVCFTTVVPLPPGSFQEPEVGQHTVEILREINYSTEVRIRSHRLSRHLLHLPPWPAYIQAEFTNGPFSSGGQKWALTGVIHGNMHVIVLSCTYYMEIYMFFCKCVHESAITCMFPCTPVSAPL